MSEGKLLEEVIEEYLKKDGCFVSWITLSHYYFALSIFLVSIVDSMVSQNPKDWDFCLAHLPNDPINFFNHQHLNNVCKMKHKFLNFVSNYIRT